jgi:hypothetical protein
MSNYQIHPIFPTIIYQCSMGSHWCDILSSKKEYQFDPSSGALTGETRDLGLMHHDPDLQDFFGEVSASIIACLDQASINTDVVEPAIMKAWCTMIDAGDTMRAHTHACSDLSFVYYVDPPDNALIKFLNPNRNPNKYFDGAYDNEPILGEKNFINASDYTMVVQKGDIIIFPSNIPHCTVGGGQSVHLRSIAGDVKLVLKHDYTSLDTGLINPAHWRVVKPNKLAHSSNTDP